MKSPDNVKDTFAPVAPFLVKQSGQYPVMTPLSGVLSHTQRFRSPVARFKLNAGCYYAV